MILKCPVNIIGDLFLIEDPSPLLREVPVPHDPMLGSKRKNIPSEIISSEHTPKEMGTEVLRK
jgi:hypothetical protein